MHRGERAGYASIATWTELLYTVARMIPWDDAVTVVELLERQNVVPIAVLETWYEAARFKHDYTVALGDAFALAAAEHVDERCWSALTTISMGLMRYESSGFGRKESRKRRDVDF